MKRGEREAAGKWQNACVADGPDCPHVLRCSREEHKKDRRQPRALRHRRNQAVRRVDVERQMIAKRGRNHEFADALWQTGWYEARMLATLVDEP